MVPSQSEQFQKLMLSYEDFKAVVSSAPLFAIDLVVLNSQKQILVGLRKNAPAQGFWFVPGGRVFKGESQSQAFERITEQELGVAIPISNAQLLGVFDHFYDDSVFGDNISTHYVNTPYLINISEQVSSLPTEQHTDYRWIVLEDLANQTNVHKYSKVFIDNLTAKLGYKG